MTAEVVRLHSPNGGVNLKGQVEHGIARNGVIDSRFSDTIRPRRGRLRNLKIVVQRPERRTVPQRCRRVFGHAGFDVRVSGVTMDRFCGSGITAVSMAAAQIRSGMEDLVIAGGTEMMSLITTISEQERAAGFKSLMMGSGNARLAARHPQSHQGVCADAIASLEGIGREALDAFSLESQQRAARAIREGRFARSTVPVVGDDGQVMLDREEYPRPDTTLADLAGLKPSFAQIADMPIDARGTTFRKLITCATRTWRSSPCTTPAVPPASWMARPRCCWPRRATPGSAASSRAPAWWPRPISETIRR